MDTIKQARYDDMYMDIAKRVSEMSYDTDTKVGAIIVKDGNIISMGWNGTPPGFPNECKHPSTGATLPYVIHAEANAITKLARTGGNGSDAVLYTTLAPCMECTKLILQSGISEVIIDKADERYMDSYGILKEKGMVRLCKSISNN